ncbi:hypothetical protein BRC64_04325 [Halobacteriales archaeon QH_10_67_22]|nr:MAG: hypothetical protein BRC64_04325 [Halobacteriales archaeon QH_10_67_22]
MIEVDSEDDPPETFFVNTSLARKYAGLEIDGAEYVEQFGRTSRDATPEERELAQEMDRTNGNTTLYPSDPG